MESRKTVHLRPLIAMSTLAKLRPLFKIRKQQTCFLRRHGSRGGFFSVPIQVLAETNKIWKDVKKQQNSITICCASIFFFSKLAPKCLFAILSWEYWIARESISAFATKTPEFSSLKLYKAWRQIDRINEQKMTSMEAYFLKDRTCIFHFLFRPRPPDAPETSLM